MNSSRMVKEEKKFLQRERIGEDRGRTILIEWGEVYGVNNSEH